MRGRKRTTNKSLPTRVYSKHGAFYYVCPRNKWHRLTTERALIPKAMRDLFDSMGMGNAPPRMVTETTSISELADAYAADWLTRKEPATRRTYASALKRIRKHLGHIDAAQLEAPVIYDLRDMLEQEGKHATFNRCRTVLMDMMNYAIRHGIRATDPAKTVKRLNPNEAPNKKPKGAFYIDDARFWTFYNHCEDERIKIFMLIALATALRPCDILSIQLGDITPEGIFVLENKKKKAGQHSFYPFTPSLKKAVEWARRIKPNLKTQNLLTNEKGNAITTDAFNQRFLYRFKSVIERGIMQESERFNPSKIRNKVASEMTTDEEAAELLGHGKNVSTTKQFYRLKPKVMKTRDINAPA